MSRSVAAPSIRRRNSRGALVIRQLLGTTHHSEVESRVASGLPIYEMMEQIRLELRRALSEQHALLFAEPNANANTGQIQWYASMEGVARPLIALAGEERQVAEARLVRLTTEIAAHAARLGQSSDSQDQHIAKALDDALQIPRESDIFVVGQQPVIAAWGHVLHGLAMRRPILQTMAERVQSPAPAPPPSPPAIRLPAPPPPPSPPPPPVKPRVTPPPVPPVLKPAAATASKPARKRFWLWLVLGLMLALLVLAAAYVYWPPPRPVGRIGHVNVVLSWQGHDDVDLEVVCPGGEAINAKNRRACNGTMDVDQNWSDSPGHINRDLVDNPVENIVWDNNAPRGVYKVRVNRFSDRPPLSATTPFKVELLIDGKVVRSVSGNADVTMREVFTFELPFPVTAPQPQTPRKP